MEPPVPVEAYDAAEREKLRSQLARNLATSIMIAIGALIAISLVMILMAGTKDGKENFLLIEDRMKLLQLLFTALLPLFGAWLGTVLTHYYSREAYESANRQVATLLYRTAPVEVSTVSVAARMISKSKLIYLSCDGDLDQVKLLDIAQLYGRKLPDGGEVERVPILDRNLKFVAIIHEATFKEMLTANGLDQTKLDAAALSTKTLSNVVGEPKDKATYRDYITTTIAFVAAHATIEQASAKRKAVAGCSDIMVTATGEPDEQLVGWLTEDQLTV
jgi:hypothetical protein